jgi:predicted lipid-binding transport protein (Tim44 family)
MGTMTQDDGQALLVAVLLLAIAAVGVVGLRAVQDRFAADARIQRAGEAAVEAAVAAVADAYVAHVVSGRAAGQGAETVANVHELLAEPRTLNAARAAADDLARANGFGPVESLDLSCGAGMVEAQLGLLGRRHRAGFAAAECSRP